jgi:hypothetical protein
MNRANALPRTSCPVPANVFFRAAAKGQSRTCSGCEIIQALGLSGSRSCELYPFALCCTWANTVKWLK